MADNQATNSKKKRINPAPIVILAALALVFGGVFWYLFLRRPPPQQPAILTPEAKAYTRNLALSDVEMNAKENLMQSTLVEITGKITNNGDRVLSLVEINCVFYDPYGQVVLRERVAIVRSKGPGLDPSETRPFRLPFDAIPSSWNQAMPQLVIARIEFVK